MKRKQLLMLLSALGFACASKTITTIAGRYTNGVGDNGPGFLATVSTPLDAWISKNGDLYIADTEHCRIRRMLPNGTIYTRVGTGSRTSYIGDTPELSQAYPRSIWGDDNDNVYYSDYYAVYVINATINAIQLVAGIPGNNSYNGDNIPALHANLNYPMGLLGDNMGHIFIADYFNNRIRNVSLVNGKILCIGGTGSHVYSGDGGLALDAGIPHPNDLWRDSVGNLFASSLNELGVVRRIDAFSSIVTTVGGGTSVHNYYDDYYYGNNDDDQSDIVAIAGDSAGNLYIADRLHRRIRIFNATSNIISTVYGNSDSHTFGDGGPASDASFDDFYGMFVDPLNSNVYILEVYDIRMVESTTGIIDTIIGYDPYYSGDGRKSILSSMNHPSAVWEDSLSNIYIADTGNFRLRLINASSGIISTVLGNGNSGWTNGVVFANESLLGEIKSIWGDSVGHIYLGDWTSSKAFIYDTHAGTLSPFAGQFEFCDNCAQDLANSTYVGNSYLTGDTEGNVYISMYDLCIIKKVLPDSIIVDFAGNWDCSYSGDGMEATSTTINGATEMWVDSLKNLYFADQNNFRIRKVTQTLVDAGNNSINISNIVTTSIGGQSYDYADDADESSASSARLGSIYGLWGDSSNHLYFADASFSMVRRWNMKTDRVTPMTANYFYSSGQYLNGVDSRDALVDPYGLWGDSDGNLLITDISFNTIRRLTPRADYDIYFVSIATVAGEGASSPLGGYSGPVDSDNKNVTQPCDVWQSSTGDLYFTECSNYYVYKINAVSGNLRIVVGNGKLEDYEGIITSDTGTGGVNGIWGDTDGLVYVTDIQFSKLRVINTTAGTIMNVTYWNVDGDVTFTDYFLDYPSSVFGDTSGSLYVSELHEGAIILLCNPNNGIYQYLNLLESFSGSTTQSSLSYPFSIWGDTLDSLFIADTGNYKIKRLNLTSGQLDIVGGGGCCTANSKPTEAVNTYMEPYSVWGDKSGHLFFTEFGLSLVRVLDIDSGIVTVIAGAANAMGYSGDGSDAADELLMRPKGIWGNSAGFVYFADYAAGNVRMLHLYSNSTPAPSSSPTLRPTSPTLSPSMAPTHPTMHPSEVPSINPSVAPSMLPTRPTCSPTANPSYAPHFNGPVIYEINTIAGSDAAGSSLYFSGDGGPAVEARISSHVNGIWEDSNGNIYFGDSDNYRIRRISYDGIITTVAGSGNSDDNIMTSAQSATGSGVGYVKSVWGDSIGNVYWFDYNRQWIRKFNTDDQTVIPVAGNFNRGKHTRASSSKLTNCYLSGDSVGVVYISDQQNRIIRKMVPSQDLMIHFAGSKICTEYVDLSTSTSSCINEPGVLWVDSVGYVYVLDTANYAIRMIDTSGVIKTIAGMGCCGAADYGVATSVYIFVAGMWGNSVGSLFFTDIEYNKIRAVNLKLGYLYTIVPVVDSSGGYDSFSTPISLTGNAYGDVVVVDQGNCRIRELVPVYKYVEYDVSISTIAGQDASISLSYPRAVWSDSLGYVYIADTYNYVIRRVDPTGILATVAGSGVYGYSTPENDDCLVVNFMEMTTLWGNTAGIIYVGIPDRNAVFVFNTLNSSISVLKYLKDSNGGYDNFFDSVYGIWGDTVGNLYFSETNLNLVIKLNVTTGNLSNILEHCQSNNESVQCITLSQPQGLWGDSLNNLYIADSGNNAIRRVDLTAGTLTHIAGSNKCCQLDNYLNGTDTWLYRPTAVWGDSIGHLFILDTENKVVRMMTISSGYTIIAAGTGVNDFNDLFELEFSENLWGNTDGEIYIAESGANRIRKLRFTDHVSRNPTAYPSSSEPSNEPTVVPTTIAPTFTSTLIPSNLPTESPSLLPSVIPSDYPSVIPSLLPTSIPTFNPSMSPSSVPSNDPTGDPSVRPSNIPSILPSWSPSQNPTLEPSVTPSATPTTLPSDFPSNEPSPVPSSALTAMPTENPSLDPTMKPSTIPTDGPSVMPSATLSAFPSMLPSLAPSICPSLCPTLWPSEYPSIVPSTMLSLNPSSAPSLAPSFLPSLSPTMHPSLLPTLDPTIDPSISPTVVPTLNPSFMPSLTSTGLPSLEPSRPPSLCPTFTPSIQPSESPSTTPTVEPSISPSVAPSGIPSSHPSVFPSILPTLVPSESPSSGPSVSATMIPSATPSVKPSFGPSAFPTATPTFTPTPPPSIITRIPSNQLTRRPSLCPSADPSKMPQSNPSARPTTLSSGAPNSTPAPLCPTVKPTRDPSMIPTIKPTRFPSIKPSAVPTLLPTAPTFQPSTDQPVISFSPTRTPSISESPSEAPSTEPTTIYPSEAPSTLLPSMAPTTMFPTEAPTTLEYYVSHPKATLPSNASISVNGLLQAFRIIIPFFDLNSGSNGNVFSSFDLTGGVIGGVSFVYGSNSLTSISLNTGQIASFSGAIAFDIVKRSASVTKDINGDGRDDLIIGDPYNSRCYVLYGTVNGLKNMTSGFTIFGEEEGDLTGWSVSSAGDVNNDTLNDIIIGAPFVRRSGAFYIIYGQKHTFDVYLTNLTLSEGFAVYSSVVSDYVGISVSVAGDVNKDGFDDVIVGAVLGASYFSGAAYVVFGSRSLRSFSTAQMTVEQGYKLYCTSYWYCGYSVSGAGDVNGDGYDDVLIGSAPQKSSITSTAYLVYGSAAVSGNVLLTSLGASQGIKITGGGIFVNIGGDVNNDGYADVLVYSNYALSSSVGLILYSNTVGLTQITRKPSVAPTNQPTIRSTSIRPSFKPVSPSLKPSAQPSYIRPSASPQLGNTVPSSYPSSRPTIVTTEPSIPPSEPPSMTPTLEPSEYPSMMPTMEPSESPTENPTAEPTREPSLFPSVVPTQTIPSDDRTRPPMTMPTTKPTLPPDLLSINIYSGNQIINNTHSALVPVRYSCNASGLISIEASSSVGVTYALIPRTDMEVIVWTFNISVDRIDLTSFTEIYQLSDFSITHGSAIINLPGNQLIRIMNHNPSDISDSCFVFNALPQNRKNTAAQYILKVIKVCLALGCFSLFIFGIYRLKVWLTRRALRKNTARRHLLDISYTKPDVCPRDSDEECSSSSSDSWEDPGQYFSYCDDADTLFPQYSICEDTVIQHVPLKGGNYSVVTEADHMSVDEKLFQSSNHERLYSYVDCDFELYFARHRPEDVLNLNKFK